MSARSKLPQDIDDQILRLHAEGLTRHDITQRLSLKPYKVPRVLVAAGFVLTHEERVTIIRGNRAKQIPDYPPGTTERILELRRQGMKRADIAVQVGVSIDKVRSDIQLSDEPPLSKDIRVAQHEKFPPEVRDRAVGLRRAGVKIADISRETGVDKGTLRC